MPEPVDGIRGGDGSERLGDGRRQGLLGPTESQLAEGLLDQGEAEGLGWKEDEVAVGGLDGGTDADAFVDTAGVADHHLTGGVGRDQDLAHGDLEGIAIDGTLPSHGRLEPWGVSEVAGRRPAGALPGA